MLIILQFQNEALHVTADSVIFGLIPCLHIAKIIWIAIKKMYLFTLDIDYSIQQSESHCCSLFSHCYIAIHLISWINYPDRDPDRTFLHDPDSFCGSRTFFGQTYCYSCIYPYPINPCVYTYNSNCHLQISI